MSFLQRAQVYEGVQMEPNIQMNQDKGKNDQCRESLPLISDKFHLCFHHYVHLVSSNMHNVCRNFTASRCKYWEILADATCISACEDKYLFFA